MADEKIKPIVSFGLIPSGGESPLQKRALDNAKETLGTEVPDLPDRLKEFAFRYATEYRTILDWSILFNVSYNTIRSWIKNKRIKTFIDAVRGQQMTKRLELFNQLQSKAYAKFFEILDAKVSGDTIDAIRKTALDIISMASGNIPNMAEGGVTVNVQQNSIQSQKQGQVASTPARSLDEIKKTLLELEQLEDALQEEDNGRKKD